MKQHTGLVAIIFVFVFTSSYNAFAADDEEKDKDEGRDSEITEILNSVGYPELQVVPLASERLRIEAKAERSNWYYQHWTIELSGLMTLYVGATAKANAREDLSDSQSNNQSSVATATTAVGLGWLVGGLLVGLDRPYTTGMRQLSKLETKKDERSALLRERLAEEALERPARTMRVLQWASIVTNAGVNALNLSYLGDKGKVTAGLGIVLAFLPLMFNDHAIDVFDKHIEYKKKIYAPLKTGSFSYDPTTRQLTPMTQLVWSF